MTVLLYTLIILYCIIASAFHYGINEEWKRDVSGDLDHLNPSFIKLMVFCTSLLWPILLIWHGYIMWKNKCKGGEQ